MNIMKITCLFFAMLVSGLHAQDLQKISIKSKTAQAFCYSADNQFFALASGNNIDLYNAGNDTKVKDINGTSKSGHSRSILDLAFNMSGSLLATASADKTVKLWSMPSGEVTQTIDDLTDKVIALKFADNDRLLVAATADMKVTVKEVNGKTLYSKKVSDKALRTLDVSADGKYFAVGGADKMISVFDLSTGELKAKLEGHKGWVRSVKFSPDGKSIASAGHDKRIFIWELESGKKTREFKERGWIYELQYSLDGKYLGAALEKNALVFYNISTGLISLKINDFDHPVIKFAISPNGKEATTIEEFGTAVKLWNIESLNISPVFRFKDSKDTSAPLILVSNPPNIIENKVLVYSDIVDLRGTVTDESGVRSLKINGRETPVRENGNFVIHLPLSIGENYVNIEVSDVNDNIALRKFIVTRKNQDGEAYNAALAKNYLFIVGINNYQSWPKLNNAVKDVNDISEVLINRYNFSFSNITMLRDEQATRSNIYNSLRSLIEKVGPQDNLVVYFSGHGYFDQLLNEGYWIPVDAHINSSGDYISNTDILKILTNINSQHTFLVADACFSGALFADSRRGYTENVEKFRSRWGLASGRLEVVSDGAVGTNSPFARKFIDFLQTNKKPKFPVSELVQFVKTQVAEETQQTPIGNPLKVLGDEGGELVFYVKD
jgi:hypothetical protein